MRFLRGFSVLDSTSIFKDKILESLGIAYMTHFG